MTDKAMLDVLLVVLIMLLTACISYLVGLFITNILKKKEGKKHGRRKTSHRSRL